MGFIEDAKETAEAAAKKAERLAKDTVDRLKDKTAEAKATAKVKQAEAEKGSVAARNDAKKNLRGD